MIDITSLWTVALLVFLGSYLALLTLRPFAVSVGLVDKAGILKRHGDSVPMIGGLAIPVGYCFVLAAHPILLEANIIGISSHHAGVSDGPMFALYVSLGAVYFLGVRRLAQGTRRTSMELARCQSWGRPGFQRTVDFRSIFGQRAL